MRRVWKIGLALIAVLALAHGALWYWAATRAKTELLTWAAARRAQGWVITIGSTAPAGWPLAALVRAHDVSIAIPLAGFPGPLSLAVPDIVVGVSALEPQTVRASLDGAMQAQLGSAAILPFTVDRISASFPLGQRHQQGETELRIERLRAGDPAQTPLLTLDDATLHAAWQLDAPRGVPVLALSLQAGPAQLPPDPPQGPARMLWALGPRIDRLDVQIALDGPIPTVSAVSNAAAFWRDGGGAINIRLTALNWGNLAASGTAHLGLDAALQPSGTASLRLSGFAEALDALATARAIPPRTATAAKAVLSLMARPQDNGPAIVEAPLTLQDRTLRFGQIPLARMPELQWSAPQ